MSWKIKLWVAVCLLLGVANTVVFVYSPQPYGLFGFLFYFYAYVLWSGERQARETERRIKELNELWRR